MKRFLQLAMGMVCSITSFQSFSQTEFPDVCGGLGYAILNNTAGGPSSLYQIGSTGAYSMINTTGQNDLNGIGFDARDGKRFIWSMKSIISSTEIKADLFRTEADGTTVNMGTVLPPTGGLLGRAVITFAGDIDAETGDYYIPAVTVSNIFPPYSYKLYIGKFNVDDAPGAGNSFRPPYTEISVAGACKTYLDAFMAQLPAYLAGGPMPSGLFQDWAYKDNKLYSFMGIENVLMVIDLASNTITCTPAPSSNATNGYVGSSGSTTDEMGGMYFDEAGNLYAVQVDRGRMFTVNTTTGELTLVGSSLFPLDSRGDATTCRSVVTLPVKYESFTAHAVNQTVLLNWITATEINNKGFEIQRSGNGTDWTTIDFVASKAHQGTSSSSIHYEYIDYTPFSDINYYRLLQHDYDGRFELSDVKVVNRVNNNSNITVFPNPIKNHFVVSGLKANDKLIVINNVGQIVWQQNIANENSKMVNMAALPNGIYYVKVVSEKGTLTTNKIVKQ